MKIIRVKTGNADILAKALAELDKKVGKVGWFKDSIYPDGTQVAEVAAQNEFGVPSRNIPARPFMRPTIKEKQPEWVRIMATESRKVLNGKTTATDALDLLGKRVVGQIKRTISRVWLPPLSPVTIANRKERRANKKLTGNLNKPLIDTGQMYTTIINVVEDE